MCPTPDSSAQSIESTILSLLIHATGHKPEFVTLEKRLVGELKLDGDDYAMSLVPEIQKRFGIRVARQRWEQVYTGRDIVEIVHEALNAKGHRFDG